MDEPSLESLADDLVLVAVHLVRRLRGLDTAPALTRAEASALAVLVFAGESTMGELARHEGVKAPTMTRLVQGMEQRKWVRRVRDEADARVSRVAVTAAGRKLFLAGQKRRLQPLIALLRALPAAERRALVLALPA